MTSSQAPSPGDMNDAWIGITNQCGISQHPLGHSTGAFLPGGFWSHLPALCLCRFVSSFSCHKLGIREQVICLSFFCIRVYLSTLFLWVPVFLSYLSCLPGIHPPPSCYIPVSKFQILKRLIAAVYHVILLLEVPVRTFAIVLVQNLFTYLLIFLISKGTEFGIF